MSKNPTNRKVGEVLNIEIKKGTENIPKTRSPLLLPRLKITSRAQKSTSS